MNEEMSTGKNTLQLKQVIHATDAFQFDIELREHLKVDPDYEISNVVYSGSFVIRGSGTAIICTVGCWTHNGIKTGQNVG
jgi:magnesium-transporting ATPase (P-type)